MPAKAERRIADLERQLEQARDKAARAEQAAKAKAKDKSKARDQPRDQPAPRPSGPRRRPGTWAVVKTIGVVTLILGALALYLFYSFRTTLSAGEVKAAHWAPSCCWSSRHAGSAPRAPRPWRGASRCATARPASATCTSVSAATTAWSASPPAGCGSPPMATAAAPAGCTAVTA